MSENMSLEVGECVFSVKTFAAKCCPLVWQSGFMELIALSHSCGESGHPQLLGEYRI